MNARDIDFAYKGGLIVLVMIALVAGAILTSGCISGNTQAVAAQPTPEIVYVTVYVTPEPTPVPTAKAIYVKTPKPIQIVEITSINDATIHYGWVEFTGVISNHDTKPHSVCAYIDLYKDGVKFDSLMIFERVDAGGKTQFKTTSTETETVGRFDYKYYIDHIY